MPDQTNEMPCKEFLTYVRGFVEQLHWIPYPDAMKANPNLIVYGTANGGSRYECFISIDWKFKLFKIELTQQDDSTRVESKCVVKYETDKDAIARFEHFMDVTGMFYKEACLNG